MADAKLRVGLIGTGFGKSTQMPGFQSRDDLAVVAVCSGHLERAQAVASEYHIPAAYDDYRAMLACERLDLVSIVTPPYLHKEMTLAALQTGAHVLCEKPMAMDVAEAQSMCDAARAAGRIGMIDHEFRYVPTRAYMKQLIDEGYIGKPYHLNITNFSSGRADPKRPFNWWSDAEKGGGLLGAIGSHYIDGIRTFVGELESVCGFVDTQIQERPDSESGQLRRVSSDDHCAFLARLHNGAIASVHLSMAVRPATGERIQAFGSGGTLVSEHDGKLWGGQTTAQQLKELPVPDALKPSGAGLVGPFTILLARLVDGIRTGATEVAPSFTDGLIVQRALDAVCKSNAGAGWVKV